MTRLASAPPLPHSAERSRPRWWREVLVLGGMYVLYDAVRMVVATGNAEAFTNARKLLGVERALHIAHEQALNHAVSARPVLAVAMAYVYAALHYLITPMVLVWLWKTRPHRYPSARTTLVAATLLGVAGFWLFPAAPPRMLPGFVDTLATYHQWGWWGEAASAPKGLAGLTNEFAAMPSLHVGWAAWCGWHVSRNAARRWARMLAVAYPFVILIVVVGTANHFFLDAAGGLAAIAAGAWLARIPMALRAWPLGLVRVR
jgi:PAP2 superfamily